LSGTFAPRQPLATFNGLAADGAWTLRVADEATFGNGTFNSWSITIDQQVPGSCGGASSCPCEVDGNEGDNVFDLLACLDLWFAGDEGAEFDGQDGINVFDLLGFLDCWFQGC